MLDSDLAIGLAAAATTAGLPIRVEAEALKRPVGWKGGGDIVTVGGCGWCMVDVCLLTVSKDSGAQGCLWKATRVVGAD